MKLDDNSTRELAGIVVGSGVSAPEKIFLLGLHNIIYVLPLIGIAIACAVMGAGAADSLGRIRDRALSRWPFVAAPWPPRSASA
jgi:hypothetical protein